MKALLEYHLRSKEPAFGTAKLHGFRAAQPDRGLKTRIGFWDILWYNYKERNPGNSIGNYLGRYITSALDFRASAVKAQSCKLKPKSTSTQ